MTSSPSSGGETGELLDRARQVSIGRISPSGEADGSRDRMYERALDSWLDDDQAAAQRWINSANLPDSVLKSLENRDQP